MTCIIALKHDNKICMVADTAITTGAGVVKTSYKIVSYPQYKPQSIVGFSGPKGVQNLMEEKTDLFVGDFSTKHLNEIWRVLAEATPSGQFSEILLSNGVDLIYMGNISSWRVITEEFECIGSGAATADGAMEALKMFIEEPERRLLQTMDITSKYCIGVQKPFQLQWISK